MIVIAGLSGSFRKNSYNTAVLKAASKMLPGNIKLELLDISKLPMFNEDLEGDELPNPVVEFKNQLSKSNALLIPSPEYNYSIPPVLKNALDWASRGNIQPLSGKPVGIISASPSLLGGARVQYHIRQVCVALNMNPVNRPEVFIAEADKKFDFQGNLIDEKSKELIKELLQELVERIK